MWTELKDKAAAVAGRHMLDLFQADPDRADRFSAQTGDMRLDYSKTNLDDDTRDQLLALAEAAGWQAKRDAMFAGAPINDTEGRAVLHTALRNLDGLYEDGQWRNLCRAW